MEFEQLYLSNKQFALELQERVQWALLAATEECWRRKYYFRITEAYRSPTRQFILWLKGRCWPETGPDTQCYPGPKVTWTLASLHGDRLAIDLVPKYCTYEQIQEVFAMWGITRPLVHIGDLGHFQFDQVPDKPRPVDPPEVQLKKKENALKFNLSPLRRNWLARGIQRLKKIIAAKMEGVE